MASETDWLAEAIRVIRTDVHEIKQDVRMLREHKAETHGKVLVLTAIVTLILNLAIHLWSKA